MTSHDGAGEMLYADVEKALYARLPEHKSAANPNLGRMRRLVDLMGQPQHSAPVIHVAGTNGKTSATRMIDALLVAFGLRTGRHTSPHLVEIRERICLSGEPISKERFVEVYQEVMPYVDFADQQAAAEGDRALSLFEITTAMTFAAFSDAPVDVSILEVGMGGTHDSTNVADGKIAAVMPVAVDHVRFLGATPAEIAVEKAGIIKPGSIAVLSQQDVDVAEVLLQRVADVGATVAREGMEFGVLNRTLAVGGQMLTLQGLSGVYEEVYLPLHGLHQAHNASVALATVEAFLAGGVTEGEGLDAEIVRQGFAAATSPARLEVVRRSPTILLDAAHNPHGAAATAEALTEAFTFEPLIGVIGSMGDKDVEGLLEAFEPVMDRVVVTQNSTMRAMPAAELAEIAVDVFGEDRVVVRPRLDEAIEEAVRLLEEGESAVGAGGVIVTGSVITAGEARVLLGNR